MKWTAKSAWVLGLLALYGQPGAVWAERPSWLGQRPRQEGVIVGIGVAPKGNDLAAAWQRARQQALQDIAGQLETQVHSRVQMLETEQAETVQREYKAEIEISVSQTLRQVEIVDTWEAVEHVWVYARFALEQYIAQLQGQVEEAGLLCERGMEREAVSIAEAVGLYVESWRLLVEVGRDPLWTNAEIGQALLEVEGHIQRLLRAIELEVLPKESGLVQEMELEVEVFTRNGDGKKRTISSLPIAFTWGKTRGDIGMARTDAQGRARVRVRPQDLPGGRVNVEARLALSAFAADSSLGGFTMPVALFSLHSERPRVYVHSLDAGAELVAFAVQEALAGADMQCVEQVNEADIALEISAQFVGAEPLGRMRFAFAKTEWVVRQVETNRLLWQTTLGPIKGAGAAFEQAKKKAAAGVGEKFRQEVLVAIVAVIRHQQGALLSVVSTANSISSPNHSPKGGEQ